MKAQWKRDRPEARGGDPAPTQVAHDHRAAGHAVEFSQYHRKFGVTLLEVMQQLRAHHDVDARVAKRERERVGAHRRRGHRELARGTAIHASSTPIVVSATPRSARRGRRVRGNVREPRSHIEQRGTRTKARQRRASSASRGVRAAEPACSSASRRRAIARESRDRPTGSSRMLDAAAARAESTFSREALTDRGHRESCA